MIVPLNKITFMTQTNSENSDENSPHPAKISEEPLSVEKTPVKS